MKTLTNLMIVILAIVMTGNLQPGSPVSLAATWLIEHLGVYGLLYVAGVGVSILVTLVVAHIGNPFTWWADFKSGKINFQ